MGWLSNLFATRRELTRLRRELSFRTSEVAVWQKKCAALEQKLERRTEQLLERDFAWSDRFLTGQVKTYAIRDEVQGKLESNPVTDESVKAQTRENYLRDKKLQLEEWAMEQYGDEMKAREAAEKVYQTNLPVYLAEFENQFDYGMSN
jgi:hypothetical protein